MNADFTRLEQRLDSIERRLEEGFSRPASLVLDEVLGLEQRTNQRLDRLTEQVENLAERVEDLTERVEDLAEGQQVMQAAIGNLSQIMAQLAQDAAADRAVMREMQTEVRGLQSENRRILDHLFGQQPS